MCQDRKCILAVGELYKNKCEIVGELIPSQFKIIFLSISGSTSQQPKQYELKPYFVSE